MSKTPSDEDVFTHLSYRPECLQKYMITINKPAKPSTLIHRPDPSSLGLLNPLPLEVLHIALHTLDFQSLSRLSRVSRRGRAVVETLPIYRDLMKYIPDTLKALGQSQLLSHFPADKLLTILCSKACVACGNFGAFLFLPSGERCCEMCLDNNQSLWVISLLRAETIYGLPLPELKKLPILKSIPGSYKVRRVEGPRPKLVSVLAAARLATIKGTMPMLATDLVTPDMHEWKRAQPWTKAGLEARLRRYMEACAELTTTHPRWLLPSAYFSRGPDEFGGMASIEFPYLLPDKTLEYGVVCKGCEWVFSRFIANDLPDHVRDYLGLWGNWRQVVPAFRERCSRVMLKSELLTHVKRCYGAKKLLDTLDIGVWDQSLVYP
ncbi:hypothetical protein FQN49_003512 [Arthroderma sp. PD_2]|nr:hypothetical protein FQN49_003512 [Arthroderma sp. PD_2]